jgi:N-acetylneuraminic acid mutarotase
VLDLNNPKSGWQELGELPFSPRVGCSAVEVGGCFYLLGGYNCWVDEQNVRRFERFDEVFQYDFSTGCWTEISPLPVKLSGHQAVAYADRYIIVIGGAPRFSLFDQELLYQSVKVDSKRGVLIGEYSDLVWVYDTHTESYDLLPDRMPHGLNDLRACIRENTIYVGGGENVDVTTSNTTNAFMIGKIETQG